MILSLQEALPEPESIVGSKAWNLAKVISAGMRVPETLIIPSTEISRILSDSGIRHIIFELARELASGSSRESLIEMEKNLKSRILSLGIPDALVREVASAVEGRISGFLIARPSPFSPGISDGDLKGRMPVWYCGPNEEEIRKALLKVLSDSFNLRAVARVLDLGAYPEDLSLALMLQQAVIPRSSGVSICCPAGRSEILVRSTWGLIDGSPTDRFKMSLDLRDLTESEVNEKKVKLLPTERGLVEVGVDSDLWLMPSLSKEEMVRVAGLPLDLSLIFGTPTVVEWMIEEGSDSIFVIQAYKDSGKPKVKALERKVMVLLESRVPGQAPPERTQAPERVPASAGVSGVAHLPLPASRVYIRGRSLELADGSVITQAQAGMQGCDRSLIVIEEAEDIREEILAKCRGSYLVLRSEDLASAEERGRRILSAAPDARLILHARDLRFLMIPRRVSSTFPGILIPIEILSGMDEEMLEHLLRRVREIFKWVFVDLQESLPPVDLICSLLRVGIRDFILNDELAPKQAQLILRAEGRILLDLAGIVLREGEF
ncbi:MAG: hypothetical protein BA066_05710 [Candidatus Korarchaeota archaeon NZ13-K]|nr:MAG: hypothetical protein BA066_05710 [Candidatus Korarchaeota archaeon NZ13-K]